MAPLDLLHVVLNLGTSKEALEWIISNREAFQPSVFLVWKQEAEEKAWDGDALKAITIATAVKNVGDVLAERPLPALSAWTLGNVHTILGDLNAALEAFHDAEKEYQNQQAWLDLARMNVGVAGVWLKKGELEKAKQLAQASWQVLQASDDPSDGRRLASLSNNLGAIYDLMGRYEESLHYYQLKLDFWQKHPPTTQQQKEIARTLINRGVVKMRLSLWAEAEEDLRTGYRLLKDLEQAGESLPRLDLVRVLGHLAKLLALSGAEVDNVQAAFAQARRERVLLPTSASDLPDLLHLDLFFATWCLQVGLITAETRALLQELWQRANQVSARERLQVDLLLADYARQTKEAETAVFAYQKICHEAPQKGDWEVAYGAWLGLGQTYLQLEGWDLAEAAFLKAVALLESIGHTVMSHDLRTHFWENKLTVYQELAQLQSKTAPDTASPASVWSATLRWLERGKARELVESLGGNQVPHSLPPAYHPLWSQLQAARQGLWQASDPAIRLTLEQQITDLVRQLERQIPRTFGWVKGESIDPQQLCADLEENTLLLVYGLMRTTLWVFPITRAGLLPPRSLGPMGTQAEIEQGVSWFYHLANYPLPFIEKQANALFASAQKQAGQWYGQWLKPIADLLGRYTKLVIIPDGPLYRVPFHAFYNTETGTYLAESHEIYYGLSATAWHLSQQQKATGFGGTAVAYDSDTLHHTEKEVAAIAHCLPGVHVYKGEEATLLRVMAEASQTNLLHLAVHGLFRHDNPLFAYLELNDGRLEMLDILRLRLPNSFVCLSACNTGRGLWRGGEYLGLARAFLVAGAKTVLASHWAVDDAATTTFMTLFYEALAREKSPSTALQMAQKGMLASTQVRYRHPYYWASFFLLGSAQEKLAL